jgi:hypothetical protein
MVPEHPVFMILQPKWHLQYLKRYGEKLQSRTFCVGLGCATPDRRKGTDDCPSTLLYKAGKGGGRNGGPARDE